MRENMKTDRKEKNSMKNKERFRNYLDRIVDAWADNDIAELGFIRNETFNDYFNGILTYNQSTVILETISKCLLVIEREKYAN